jgi:hypothetical protein
MIEIFSWGCTILILLGFYLNSESKSLSAAICWITGDIGWIIYDIHIQNPSHAVLSAVIILINLKFLKSILNVSNKSNETM